MTDADADDTADRYRTLAGAFATKVAAIGPDQWDDPTPCEDWTVRDLVRHVVDTQGLFEGLVGRDLGEIPSVDDDAAAAFAAARAVIQADLDDPARAGETFEGFFGTSTFAQAIDRFVCFDLVVHGWDLARATGQDETIDPAEIATGHGRHRAVRRRAARQRRVRPGRRGRRRRQRPGPAGRLPRPPALT